MKVYKHIFFDLDRTLWDLDANSKQTLQELYIKYIVPVAKDQEIDFESFFKIYTRFNDQLWEDYRNNKIDKWQLRSLRFKLTLKEFGIENNSLTNLLADEYVKQAPLQKILIPNAREVLTYLKSKSYTLHIITNGFTEAQHTKLNNTGLVHFFDRIITSEQAGANKPHKKIFDYGLKTSGAKANQSLMIGDDIMVDCMGAKNAGIDQIYFNPLTKTYTEEVTYEINHLSQIETLL